MTRRTDYRERIARRPHQATCFRCGTDGSVRPEQGEGADQVVECVTCETSGELRDFFDSYDVGVEVAICERCGADSAEVEPSALGYTTCNECADSCTRCAECERPILPGTNRWWRFIGTIGPCCEPKISPQRYNGEEP